MSFERQQKLNKEKILLPDVEIERGFTDFVPKEFLDNPVGYFERYGKNIKEGEVVVDKTGRVREDPTAVKDLPVWENSKGEQIVCVGKRVNILKGNVIKSGDPFYEYEILKILYEEGLPGARPIVKVKQGESHIIVMERIPGIRWTEKEALILKTRGYSDDDIQNLKNQAQQKMEEVQQQFEAAGIIRKWALKDMVFQIDIENKKIIRVMPTDWERTKIIKIPSRQNKP